MNKEKNLIFFEISRHYDTDKDTMFVRLHINGKDVDFVRSSDKKYTYISLK